MSQFTDVLDVLCDDTSGDGYGCDTDAAEAALKKWEEEMNTPINDIPEDDFDDQGIADIVFSESKYWE